MKNMLLALVVVFILGFVSSNFHIDEAATQKDDFIPFVDAGTCPITYIRDGSGMATGEDCNSDLEYQASVAASSDCLNKLSLLSCPGQCTDMGDDIGEIVSVSCEEDSFGQATATAELRCTKTCSIDGIYPTHCECFYPQAEKPEGCSQWTLDFSTCSVQEYCRGIGCNWGCYDDETEEELAWTGTSCSQPFP